MDSSVADLERRVALLEAHWGVEAPPSDRSQLRKSPAAEYLDDPAGDSESQGRVRAECRALGMTRARFYSAPEDYYERPLEYRASLLGCSTRHLCKSVLMKNLWTTATDCSDVTNSLYYTVIVQYVSKLSAESLKKGIRELREEKSRLPSKQVNFRLAPPELCEQLTGFGFNGVSPFGSLTRIPIVISKAIAELDPPFIWLGGGEVHLKLFVDVRELLERARPLVIDCTSERE